jgi:ribosomal protein S12 methylthiotransferase accessory factor
MMDNLETMEKIERAVDRETGLITALFQVATEPDDPHLFYYNAVLCHADRYAPLPVAWRRIQGGGVDISREGAITAAVGECIERYCAMIYSREELNFSTFNDLEKEGLHAVSPEKFSLFSPEQYKSPGFPFEPVNNDSRLNWVWGYSFTEDEPVLVPAAFVFLPYVYPDRKKGEKIVTQSISTGLSCRDTLESALLYGILEVIERDALTLTWLTQAPAPEIQRELPQIQALYKRVSHMKGEFHLFDITTDIKIPVVLAVGYFPHPRQPAAVTGASCRPTLEFAAAKALMEVGQEYPVAKWLMHQNPKYVYRPDYADVTDFDNHVHFHATQKHMEQFNFLFQNAQEKEHEELSGSHASMVEKLIHLFKVTGMDVIAVDITTPDVKEFGFCVVRVIIPQLQPLNGDYRFRILGGRRLNLFKGSKEVNPLPHPFP